MWSHKTRSGRAKVRDQTNLDDTQKDVHSTKKGKKERRKRERERERERERVCVCETDCER